MEWFFDGLGTEIVGVLIGVILGGTVGYKIGVYNSKINQTQRAKDGANQSQIGKQVSNKKSFNKESIVISKNTIKQKQKAKNDSIQNQIGEK